MAAGLLIILLKKRACVTRCVGLAMILIAGGFMAARWDAHSRPPMPYLPRHAVEVSGRICGISLMAPRAEGQAATRRLRLCHAVFHDWLNDAMAPLRREILIRLRPEDATPLSSGQMVRVRAMLRPPPWPVYPGARDLQREAWFSGEAGRGYALEPVQPMASKRVLFNREGMATLREKVARRIAQHLSGQVGAIAQTILCGETGGLSRHTRDIYAASGLAHLLAVAGLHLGLVMGFTLFLLRHALALWPRAALNWPCREIAFGTAWMMGAGYVLLTGAHLPALRSLGMATLIVIALMSGRQALSLRSWSIVAMALLIGRPSVALDVSFQMSFAAVLALITGYEKLRPLMRRLHHRRDVLAKMRTHLVMLTATSFFAGLATLPIVAAHYNVVQPWFILANILAVPIAAIFIMPMGVMALLAMPFHLEAGFLQVMRYGISSINVLAEWVTHFPIAQIPIPHAPDWAMLIYGVSLCFLCLVRSIWRLAALSGIAVVVLSPWLVTRPDILISSDAALTGVRRGHALYLTKPGFMQKGAAQKWVDDFSLKARAFDDLRHDPEMDCDGDLCLLDVAGRHVLFNIAGPRRALNAARGAYCARSVIKINVAPAWPLCREAGQIDRFHAWRVGATAIYMAASSPRLVTDRAWRGARLWVPSNGGQGVPNLPLAPEE